jgi:hypothetical protein
MRESPGCTVTPGTPARLNVPLARFPGVHDSTCNMPPTETLFSSVDTAVFMLNSPNGVVACALARPRFCTRMYICSC